MSKQKQIPITCEGSRSVAIDQLFDFQGNLKTLERSEAEKLKRSILKHGFSFPVMVWGDKILDGHQRLFCVRELLKQGYDIADIPIVDIQADTDAEAAEKLLLINSHYAKITDEGLYEFLNEHSLDIGSLAGDLELPGIDIEKFLVGWTDDKEPEKETGSQNQQGDELQYQILVTCSTENEQTELMEYLNQKGVKCKPLIL